MCISRLTINPVYWLGPFLGSVVAVGFYKFIKLLEYETANPDQDSDHQERKSNRPMSRASNVPRPTSSHLEAKVHDDSTTDASLHPVDSPVSPHRGGYMSDGSSHLSPVPAIGVTRPRDGSDMV